MDKRYTIQKNVQLFESQTEYEYFNWWDYFKDIIKADYLADIISKKLLRKDLGPIKSLTEWINRTENSEIK